MILKILLIPYRREGREIYFFVGLGKHNPVWRFPTGHIGDEKHNAGESISSGAKRELREELGVSEDCKVIKTELTQTFSQDHSNRSRSGKVKEVVFIANVTGQKIKIQSEEFSDYKFLPYDNAISMLHYEKHKVFLRKLYPKIIGNSLKD